MELISNAISDLRPNLLLERIGNLAALLGLGLSLYGCGSPDPNQDFKGDEFFESAPEDVIAPRWIRVSSLRVEGHSEYDAHLEVAVKGVRGDSGNTRCDLLTSHVRFRNDRPWSPLPIALFSPQYESPDKKEDLNDLFRATLDFDNRNIDPSGLSVAVSFTRTKVFTAKWHIYPWLGTRDGSEICEAVAVLEKNSQVACHGARCRIREIVAVVDGWRHFWQGGRPPREMDDLSALLLHLEDLDGDGLPNGETYTGQVPEFK